MSDSQLNASLLRLKLLDALRSGDPTKVDSIFDDLSKTKATTHTQDIIQLRETILHYAVQIAPLSMLQYLINDPKFDLDINCQDIDGNTPLHLAAASSRLDVVKYLLSLPDINDTIVNLKKKQPVEVAKDVNVAQLMQFERAKFVEQAAGQLRQYFSNRDFKNLENLLVLNPRASELLDINGADPETGNTVFHEFIKKNDVEMCDWILKHGGDPFKRDKRGRLPIDLVSKNDHLKKLIKDASKDQTIMDPVINTNNAIKVGLAPTYKGYLRKWTNFASGYKLRYFVLDQNGILSYYTNQDDTNNACRGSLNLGYASLHLDSSEKLKFEIIGKNGIRWHLKANHPIETNRWVWTLQNAITLAKDNIKRKRIPNIDTNANSNTATSTPNSPDQPNSINQITDENAKEKHHRLRIPGRKLSKHKRTVSNVSLASQTSDENDASSRISKASNFSRKISSETPANLVSLHDDHNSIDKSYADSYDAENFDRDGEDDTYESENEESSHLLSSTHISEQVATIKRSLDIEISSLHDLFKQYGLDNSSTDERKLEICDVGLSTIGVIQDLLMKYDNIVVARDGNLIKALDRQLEVNKLWENSISQLEDEIRKREIKLSEYEGKKQQLKRYLATKSGSSTPNPDFGPGGVIGVDLSETESQKKATNSDYISAIPDVAHIHDPVISEILQDSEDEDEFFDAGEFDHIGNDSENKSSAAITTTPTISAPHPVEGYKEEVSESKREIPQETADETEQLTTPATDEEVVTSSTHKQLSGPVDVPEVIEEIPQSKEVIKDDFVKNPAQANVAEIIEKEKSFAGYENPPRKKLSMDEDNRPKVGLWGILKSMIGKDMTRMTLPVSFNEPTSLLQRLSEDIECSYLLDKACTYEDSTLRMIYVATFAASEYASSTGRIAKPFNPLLGETFEYCRPELHYRLLTEQVSHHPPISACSVQSPKWDYYGENAVDSKFTGRAFDIKHLGKMFCALRPDKGVVDLNGHVVAEELYSWKKVNTAVVGIIVGNPTVDNYGLMEVKNHTTGDSIIVDMKQRGWKASSAYQLSGHVVDRHGEPQWAMGGRWNSKIFAKKTNSSNVPGKGRRNSLLEDQIKISSDDPYSGQKFLVWQVAPRPNVPFNLTAFATSLNNPDPKILEWAAPTDTRLRPDQRAMEEGRYDEASDEKHRVEEKQRAAKKDRDAKKQVYKPKWFVKKVHPVTGDKYWEFKGKYWQLRSQHQLKDAGDIF